MVSAAVTALDLDGDDRTLNEIFEPVVKVKVEHVVAFRKHCVFFQVRVNAANIVWNPKGSVSRFDFPHQLFVGDFKLHETHE